MRGIRFFGILMSCILVLLLAVEAGFVSIAWAEKPPWAGAEKEYGYARLTDGPSYVVWSDVDASE